MSTPDVTYSSSILKLGLSQNNQNSPIDPRKAILRLTLALSAANENDDFVQLYNDLIEWLPHFSEQEVENLINKSLMRFLELTAELPIQQKQLAERFGDYWTSKIPDRGHIYFYIYVQKAIDYYTKAKQIAERMQDHASVHKIDEKISQILANSAYEVTKNETFKKRIDASCKNASFEQVKWQIESIETLKQICFGTSTLAGFVDELYDQASSVMLSVSDTSFEKYQPLCLLIQKNRKQTITKSPPSSQRYQEKLKEFRQFFFNLQPGSDLGDFQRLTTQKFIEFLNYVLTDTFAILGPPPEMCKYDIRIMGSAAKNELCPYSDFEPMILMKLPIEISDKKVEKEKKGLIKAYFKELWKLLNIQICMLGETALDGSPIFKSIHKWKNPSGLHLDGKDYLDTLIDTPEEMARLQAQQNMDNASPMYTTLRSVSICTNDPQLHIEFQEIVSQVLKKEDKDQITQRKKLAIHSIKWDLNQLYNNQLAVSFEKVTLKINIKKEFLQSIGCFINNLAFYFNLNSLNTCDTMDELVDKKVFDPLSGSLLKKIYFSLYRLRIKIHLFYEEQKDEAVSFKNDDGLYCLTPDEFETLETAYWFGIHPLYQIVRTKFEKKEYKLESYFKHFDLLLMGLESASKSPRSNSVVRLAAKHLTELQATYEKHHSIYQMLDQTNKSDDSLRAQYLENLQPEIIQQLAPIPNSSGFRQSTLQQEQNLEKALLLMTSTEPSQSSPRVTIFRHGWSKPRFLIDSVKEKIIEKNTGRLLKSYEGSAHRVSKGIFKNENLHFKDLPTHPLMEYAIFDLSSRLYPNLTPVNELVRFDIEINKNKISYPVLVSQTIPGENLKEINQLDWNQCDQYQWTWMLLATILTCPGDGRQANYILTSQKTIHCIDNDISFVIPVEKQAFNWRNVNFCSSLFCFFLNNKLNRDALIEFSKLDSDQILTSWIARLIDKEKKYSTLFNEQEQRQLFDQEQQGFKPNILFRTGALATLKIQFYHLKHFIDQRVSLGGDVTSKDLLSQMIMLGNDASQVVGPYIFDTYDKAIRLSLLSDRLKAVTNRVQDTSLSSKMADKATLGMIPKYGDLKKDGISLKEAKKELDLTIQNSEVSLVGSSIKGGFVSANFQNVSLEREQRMLEGIAQLRNTPVSLSIAHSQSLNPAILAQILHSNLAILDIRYCKTMQTGFLEIIKQLCPNLVDLTLIGCDELFHFCSFKGIFRLVEDLEFPSLQSLTIDRCAKLTTIKLKAPSLKRLRISHNPNLEILETPKGLNDVEIVECPDLPFEVLLGYRNAVIAQVASGALRLSHLPINFKHDKEIVMASIKRNPYPVSYASIPLKMDEEIQKIIIEIGEKEPIRCILQEDWTIFKILPDAYRREKRFIEIALKANSEAWLYLPEDLKSDQNFILQALTFNSKVFTLLSDNLRNDNTFVIEALKVKGLVLEFTTDLQKDDPNFVSHAVEQNPESFVFASERIHSNKEYFRTGRIPLTAFPYLSQDLRDDYYFVEELIKKDPSIFEFISSRLKDNKNLALLALNQDGALLLFTSERIQDDEEVVKVALINGGSDHSTTLQYASERLKNDKKFALWAVSQSGDTLRFISDKLKDDEEIVWTAVKNHKSAFRYASERFFNDKSLALLAVAEDGFNLIYFSERLKDDEDVVRKAILNIKEAIEYASERLKQKFK